MNHTIVAYANTAQYLDDLVGGYAGRIVATVDLDRISIAIDGVRAYHEPLPEVLAYLEEISTDLSGVVVVTNLDTAKIQTACGALWKLVGEWA